MKVSGNPKNITVTQRAFASCIGVTQPRVSQLIKDGIVLQDEKSAGGGVYLVSGIINYMRSKSGSDEEDVDYMTEKAKHEKTKREIAELRLAKMEHSVYDAHTVELVMTEQYSNLRTQLLGLPSKLAPQLEGKKKEDIYAIMTREIEEKLEELAEYSPDLFTQEEIETAEDDEDSE
ncbi:hypothetical protein [Mitsuokella sp.]|uniref:hypothetical protein n=1 Tax=Mitsuokella sp. TaxID=2049034 RepID=UPI003D7CBA95